MWVDTVEKRFCSSERARLIQDQAPMRNVDSEIHSPRFDCCVFLFYSPYAATFSTVSANSGSDALSLANGLGVVERHLALNRCRGSSANVPSSMSKEANYKTLARELAT